MFPLCRRADAAPIGGDAPHGDCSDRDDHGARGEDELDRAPVVDEQARVVGDRGAWWAILEWHVVAFEEVELPVMAGAFDVGALVEFVVVAQDLTEVLAVEGGGGSWWISVM